MLLLIVVIILIIISVVVLIVFHKKGKEKFIALSVPFNPVLIPETLSRDGGDNTFSIPHKHDVLLSISNLPKDVFVSLIFNDFNIQLHTTIDGKLLFKQPIPICLLPYEDIRLSVLSPLQGISPIGNYAIDTQTRNIGMKKSLQIELETYSMLNGSIFTPYNFIIKCGTICPANYKCNQLC